MIEDKKLETIDVLIDILEKMKTDGTLLEHVSFEAESRDKNGDDEGYVPYINSRIGTGRFFINITYLKLNK